MMTASRRIGLGLGATALAVLALGAGYQNISAQGQGGGQFGGPGGPGGRRGGPGGPGALGSMMLERLNLTTDQRDRVRQIMDSHREEQQALGKRAMQAHGALQDAIARASIDEGLVRTRAAEAAVVDADMAVAQARVYSEVYQILTPDQQEQLKTLQAEMKQRRQDGPGGRGGRGGRPGPPPQ